MGENEVLADLDATPLRPVVRRARPNRQAKRGGWLGIVFVLGLLVVAAMVSLPTASASGEHILSFYAALRSLIIAQQVAGALLLIPFWTFARALARQRPARPAASGAWIRRSALLLMAAELATNLAPVALALLPHATPAVAHRLTVVEDLADAALFVAIAALALAWSAVERGRLSLRLLGLAVAAVTLGRAIVSPLGLSALDVVAPVAFLGLVLFLSVRLLRAGPVRP